MGDTCLVADDQEQEIGWFVLEEEAKVAGQRSLDSAVAELVHPSDWGKFDEEFGPPPEPIVERRAWQQSWDSAWRLVAVVIEEFPVLPGFMPGELDVQKKSTVEVEKYGRRDIDDKLADLDSEISRLQHELSRLREIRRAMPPDTPPATPRPSSEAAEASAAMAPQPSAP